MAVSLKSGETDELVENGEINVTPFIDVILVLLIIFMVAAPLSTVDVPVDLPAAHAQPSSRAEKPVFVTLKADLSVLVGEEAVTPGRFGSMVDVATGLKRDSRIFIRADKAVPYGEIMKLFNDLRANGYLKVAMVALDQAPVQGKTP